MKKSSKARNDKNISFRIITCQLNCSERKLRVWLNVYSNQACECLPLHVELEIHDVSVHYRIILSILLIRSVLFAFCLASKFYVILVRHSFRTDETLFKIGMNYTSCLWCQSSLSNRPTFDLIFAASEVMYQIQSFITSPNDLRYMSSGFIFF